MQSRRMQSTMGMVVTCLLLSLDRLVSDPVFLPTIIKPALPNIPLPSCSILPTHVFVCFITLVIIAFILVVLETALIKLE